MVVVGVWDQFALNLISKLDEGGDFFLRYLSDHSQQLPKNIL